MNSDSISFNLGANLSKLLEERSMTKSELSFKAGISCSTLTFVSKGRSPSVKTVIAICNALEIPVHKLFEGIVCKSYESQPTSLRSFELKEIVNKLDKVEKENFFMLTLPNLFFELKKGLSPELKSLVSDFSKNA